MGSLFPEPANQFFKNVQGLLIEYTSWMYVLSVGTIMFFAFWLMVSRYGDIKLGPDHSAPEYGRLSWFSMLFSAGMGIGLLFFGVSEPVMHMATPPVGEGFTATSAQEAMKITFFHWGLHAWSIYAIFAVILAYFAYRKNLPLLPRSAFYPLLGERINGWMGDAIDSFAVISTMFGVATSLGLGVTQVNAGLSYLFEIPQSATIQMVLIGCITAMATLSVVMGLDGGIKRLSNLNMILAVSLLAFILIFGETVLLFKLYVQNTGAYLSDIIYKTFNLYTYEKKAEWVGGWTLLYWGWWVSWAPFVGMFIARISKGRTIREFLWGVLFIPSGFTFLWMTVFGNSAIHLILNKGARGLADTVNDNVSIALFQFFEYFPGSMVLTGLGVMLVVTFFVSSSDSGSLVIDTLASGGAEDPPVWQRIYWAVMEGLVAGVLLLTGGLEALQTMTIASAFPMMFLILVGCILLVKTLHEDYLLSSSVQTHDPLVATQERNWKERLHHLMGYAGEKDVYTFLSDRVVPALKELKKELENFPVEVTLDMDKNRYARIYVTNDNGDMFQYGVRIRPFSGGSPATSIDETYFRAEVFLVQGGQNYDIFGYSIEQIIADAITQYERHLHFLHIANSQLSET